MTIMEKALLREDRECDSIDACTALSKYYGSEQPLRALAYAYKANRMGAKLNTLPLEAACMTVSERSDLVGAYLLGREYSCFPRTKQNIDTTLRYLRHAADTAGSLQGAAALCLADYLSRCGAVNREYREMAFRYYRVAKEQGNGDLI